LSALLAAEIQSDLLIMMSDVDGIYNKPPWEDGARMLHTYSSKEQVQFGQKSKVRIIIILINILSYPLGKVKE
jgi:delta-1-pyrroline-5-carboxylate synthetase